VLTDEEMGEASGNCRKLQESAGNCATHPFISCTIHEILLELSSPLWHVAHRGKNEKFVQNGVPKEKRHLDSLGVRLRWVMILTTSTETGQAGRRELYSRRSEFEPDAGSCEHDSECFGSIQVAYPGVTS